MIRHSLLIFSCCSFLLACGTKHSLEKRPEVPINLEESLLHLENELSSDEIKELRAMEDIKGMIDYHYSLGLWIRNNWLNRNSPLVGFFISRGVFERDDMSGIILDEFWRRVHGQPIQFSVKLRERIESGSERITILQEGNKPRRVGGGQTNRNEMKPEGTGTGIVKP